MIACVSKITNLSGFAASFFTAVFFLVAMVNYARFAFSNFNLYTVRRIWNCLPYMLRPLNDDEGCRVRNYFIPTKCTQFVGALEAIRVNMHKPLPLLIL